MAASDLKRTSPLTVMVRSVNSLVRGLWVLIALVIVGPGRGEFSVAGLGVAALVLLVVGGTIGYWWVRWWNFAYGVAGDDLLVQEGLLVRTKRTIPLNRVQGIDIRADLVSRILGLADVVVETAGGGDNQAEARIGAVPLSEAEALRFDLLHRKESAEAQGVTDVVGPDPLGRMSDVRGVMGGAERGRVEASATYRVPITRLVLAGVTSNAVFIVLAGAIGLVGQAYELFGTDTNEAVSAVASLAIPFLILAVLMLGLLVMGIAVAYAVARDFGFLVRRAGARLETEAGLFERRMTSLPVTRIQALRIEKTALRRLLGFSAVYADTAGFGGTREQDGTDASTILPLVKDAETTPLLHSLLPELYEFPAMTRVPRRGLRFFVLWPTVLTALIVGVATGATTWSLGALLKEPLFDAVAPALAAGLTLTAALVAAGMSTLVWRATRFGVADDALGVGTGALADKRVRIGRTRIQSLTVRQSWFQRRAGLATMVVASVSGSSQRLYHIRNLDQHDAWALAEWYSPSPSAEPVST